MPREDEAQKWMRRALALARRGRGLVEPNPMVGALLVREGVVLAEGYHERYGGPHAEVVALDRCRAAGHDPAGAHVFVTLEPCCHHGKTPPCTDALIAAKVARVTAAMVDPSPHAAGKGIEALRGAGIAVDVGVLEEQARRLNEPFIKRVATGLPWVIAKWAQTLDGRIATSTGESKWISGERARRLVHQWRARVDAIVVGIGTVLADDPRLTARGVPRRRRARRIVVDPSLRLPMDSALVQSLRHSEAPAEGDGRKQGKGRDKGKTKVAPLTVAISQAVHDRPPAKLAALEALGVEVLPLPPWSGESSRLSLRPLLAHLAGAHAATNVLVEGGAKLLGSLMEQGLVDQVLAFVAPKLLGDDAATAAVRGFVSERMDMAKQLTLRTHQRLGDDVLLDYRVCP